jgi:hypothetical protein
MYLSVYKLSSLQKNFTEQGQEASLSSTFPEGHTMQFDSYVVTVNTQYTQYQLLTITILWILKWKLFLVEESWCVPKLSCCQSSCLLIRSAYVTINFAASEKRLPRRYVVSKEKMSTNAMKFQIWWLLYFVAHNISYHSQ